MTEDQHEDPMKRLEELHRHFEEVMRKQREAFGLAQSEIAKIPLAPTVAALQRIGVMPPDDDDTETPST